MIQNETIQNNFIDRTQSDCNLLTTTSSVHWEWFYGWHPTFEVKYLRLLRVWSKKKNDTLSNFDIFQLRKYNFMQNLIFHDTATLTDKIF